MGKTIGSLRGSAEMANEQAISIDSNFDFFRRSETLLSLALLGILVVLLVPLPPFILDMLLTTNLGLTVLLLLVVLGVTHPLEISVFPSLLLLMTLYRLSLNVATTRLVLLDGDAGRIVSTFGGFVVGGNLIVGFVIFLILVIVQFIVITRGAGRVSEVAARFTLDALPGKQMAIDAELGAGAIDEATARSRRQQLAEAEFYGAMDGASKFVRGDAIAGLIVTAVNLIGGVILGVSGGLTLAEAHPLLDTHGGRWVGLADSRFGNCHLGRYPRHQDRLEGESGCGDRETDLHQSGAADDRRRHSGHPGLHSGPAQDPVSRHGCGTDFRHTPPASATCGGG